MGGRVARPTQPLTAAAGQCLDYQSSGKYPVEVSEYGDYCCRASVLLAMARGAGSGSIAKQSNFSSKA